MSFAYNPPNGYENTTVFPTKPPNEAAFRASMQELFNQVRDYMNTSLLIVTDGNLTIVNVDQRLLLQAFYDAGVEQYSVIDSKNGAGEPTELRINPSGGPMVLKFVDQRLVLQSIFIPGVGQHGLIQATNGAGAETELRINPNGGSVLINGGQAWHAGNAGPFYKGAGSPEGTVAAPVGAIYQSTNGGTITTLYVKTSGTGNTGWTAK